MLLYYYFFFKLTHCLLIILPIPYSIRYPAESIYKISAIHTPINVSFGIEFEMIVLYEAKKYEAELKSGEGVHWQSSSDESIIGLREKMLILIRIEMIKVLTDYGIPTNKWDRAEDYTKWTVEHDGTIALEEDRVQDWCAIELKTPAFFSHPWAFDEVKRVLNLVKKNFTTVVNDSCGLHIHVRNCHKGYPLRILKNLLCLSLHSSDTSVQFTHLIASTIILCDR